MGSAQSPPHLHSQQSIWVRVCPSSSNFSPLSGSSSVPFLSSFSSPSSSQGTRAETENFWQTAEVPDTRGCGEENHIFHSVRKTKQQAHCHIRCVCLSMSSLLEPNLRSCQLPIAKTSTVQL